jgi:hypothetical protein
MCAEASNVLRAVAADFFLTASAWKSLQDQAMTMLGVGLMDNMAEVNGHPKQLAIWNSELFGGVVRKFVISCHVAGWCQRASSEVYTSARVCLQFRSLSS